MGVFYQLTRSKECWHQWTRTRWGFGPVVQCRWPSLDCVLSFLFCWQECLPAGSPVAGVHLLQVGRLLGLEMLLGAIPASCRTRSYPHVCLWILCLLKPSFKALRWLCVKNLHQFLKYLRLEVNHYKFIFSVRCKFLDNRSAMADRKHWLSFIFIKFNQYI